MRRVIPLTVKNDRERGQERTMKYIGQDLTDKEREQRSLEAGIDCSHDPNIPERRSHTRQEFKNEADINNILKHFGPQSFVRTPEFGDQDFDTDLQRAMIAVEDTKRQWNGLPPALKKRYPKWYNLITAAADGTLDLSIPQEETPPAPPVSTNKDTVKPST